MYANTKENKHIQFLMYIILKGFYVNYVNRKKQLNKFYAKNRYKMEEVNIGPQRNTIMEGISKALSKRLLHNINQNRSPGTVYGSYQILESYSQLFLGTQDLYAQFFLYKIFVDKIRSLIQNILLTKI